MWLIGAGCSASAGVPTADDMLWEFKQQLYVSQRRVSLKIRQATSPIPPSANYCKATLMGSGRFPPRWRARRVRGAF